MRILIFILALWFSSPVIAQQLSREQIVEALEKRGCVSLAERKIKICACFLIGQPGSGKTQIKPDFVGPRTIKAMT